MEYLEVGEQIYIDCIQHGKITDAAVEYAVKNNITQWVLDILTTYRIGKRVQQLSVQYDNLDSFMASMTDYQHNIGLIIKYNAAKIAEFVIDCNLATKSENIKLQMITPMKFWFCKNVGLAIPFVYISTPVRLQLRPLEELFHY